VELLSRVDRVMFNSEEGVARTTLVKFLLAKTLSDRTKEECCGLPKSIFQTFRG